MLRGVREFFFGYLTMHTHCEHHLASYTLTLPTSNPEHVVSSGCQRQDAGTCNNEALRVLEGSQKKSRYFHREYLGVQEGTTRSKSHFFRLFVFALPSQR